MYSSMYLVRMAVRLVDESSAKATIGRPPLVLIIIYTSVFVGMGEAKRCFSNIYSHTHAEVA